MYLWDVHSKYWNTKHFKAFVLLTQASLGSFGLGFESYYSGKTITKKYNKYYCLDIHLLWVHLMLGAEWGRKAETDAMFRRLLDEARRSQCL